MTEIATEPLELAEVPTSAEFAKRRAARIAEYSTWPEVTDESIPF